MDRDRTYPKRRNEMLVTTLMGRGKQMSIGKDCTVFQDTSYWPLRTILCVQRCPTHSEICHLHLLD